jgi:hypothetical protein
LVQALDRLQAVFKTVFKPGLARYNQINFKLKSPGPTLEMMMQAIGSCADA